MPNLKITKIKKLDKVHDRYDLNVPKTSNFYANGILIHNTSARFTNAKVKRKLSLWEEWLKWFGVKVEEYEWDTLAGSRRVIKDTKAEKDHVHYYDEDVWNATLEEIAHLIPKNWVIYGEIIGWTGDKPIMKNYTYQIPKGQKEFYVYRITVVNDDGVVLDMAWDQIKEFCNNNGLKHVPELWRGLHKNFNADDWMNIKFKESGFKSLPLDKKSPCDEGVCVRREGITPYVTKAKSPDFLVHETKQLDSGEADMETEES